MFFFKSEEIHPSCLKGHPEKVCSCKLLYFIDMIYDNQKIYSQVVLFILHVHKLKPRLGNQSLLNNKNQRTNGPVNAHLIS